jgi:hypothetical protein
MGRCETCGAELHEGSGRFCGGDRCRQVFMKPADQGGPGIAARATTERAPGRGAAEFDEEVGDEAAPGVLQREAGDLGALRH